MPPLLLAPRPSQLSQTGWADFFSLDWVKKELQKIEKFLEGPSPSFNPPLDKVLRFTGMELSRVKIIILGQDPYPQPGAATGRAFEVGTLDCWRSPFRNTSLKNIVRALYQYHTGSTKKYLEILPEIGKTFPLPSPGNLFALWEDQGVLLLNTSLTCALGKPGSHAALWSGFSSLLVEFLSQRLPQALWILWGNHAGKQLAPFPKVQALRSRHPMLCAPGHPDDFLYGKLNCFRETKNLVNWLG